jgi:DNA-binding helix-hairpin-helix protein with protein kinase domain
MKQKVRLSNDTIIEVANTPFASGGEGDVYEILSPINYTKQVLKIYKTEKRTKSREGKINFLIANKPNLVPLNDHHSVIWPIHLAHISNNFVGYTMPKASGIKLELLCHPKLPKNLPKEWERLSFQTPGSIEARLKLCFNISAALSQIHSFGSYVLVDMKPDNVIVKPDGLISIIDIDSTEILKNNTLLFPAQVATPEYTPPEYYTTIKDIEKNVIHETWDRFSIAIIFYRLLFGIHPFTASLKSPFEALTNISDIIQKGFLPSGKSKDKFRIIPPPHINFKKIDNQIQHLFLNALEESHNNPNLRPTADDWCRILSPDPGIQINRQLPSRSIVCFVPLYSQAIGLKAVPEIKIEKPQYLKVKTNEGILTKLVRFFKKTEKEKMYQVIQTIQNRIENELSQIEGQKKQLQIERSKRTEEIVSLLKNEKDKIEVTSNSYVLKSKTIDKTAQGYFIKEAEKYSAFQRTFLKEFNWLELKIKEEYEITVKNYEYNNTKERDELTAELRNINNKESEQIKQLDLQLKKSLDDIKTKIQKLELDFSEKIDNESKSKLQVINLKRNQLKQKEKKLLTEALEKYQSTFTNSSLNQFKISDDKYSIFTDSYADPDRIVANLSRNGITTAADIKGVDESGRILKSNGSWVKVPDVALTRAKKLDEWRRRKERTSPSASPPQTLPYSDELKVKQILAVEIQKIDEEEKSLREQMLKSKSNIPSQLSIHLSEAKKLERHVTNDIQGKKMNMSSIFKIEREKIHSKLNDHLSNYNKLKIIQQQLFDKNVKHLRDKIDVLKREKDEYCSKIKSEFDPFHIALVSKLKNLDDLFQNDSKNIRNVTLGKMNEVKIKYELTYDTNTTKLQDVIRLYNDTANELLAYQNQYEQLK